MLLEEKYKNQEQFSNNSNKIKKSKDKNLANEQTIVNACQTSHDSHKKTRPAHCSSQQNFPTYLDIIDWGKDDIIFIEKCATCFANCWWYVEINIFKWFLVEKNRKKYWKHFIFNVELSVKRRDKTTFIVTLSSPCRHNISAGSYFYCLKRNLHASVM